MNSYTPKEIEPKWQKHWLESRAFAASDAMQKEKKYVLIEFPYPSGAGLHMGHLRPYVAGDVYSRFLRMRGNEVLYPIGWDAFGLPAENYAIKHGVHPRVSTEQNIANAKKQLLSWGISFDWDREVNTTDPTYYKWTQWIFLQFYKAGLAYEATGLINWCPKDKTGLANEEVIDGTCERCGTEVTKKELRQWYLKITAYAEKLLDGLKDLPEWPDLVKTQQENWIGKSEGAEIDFAVKGSDASVTVFTTRPDTLFGATYMVLAPEHPLVAQITTPEQKADVEAYVTAAQQKNDLQRSELNKEKTGVFTGAYAINPANGKEIPIWIADYVVMGYGTGAIMAVPAHDERDFEFATKFTLPIIKVVVPEAVQTMPRTAMDIAAGAQTELRVEHECYTGTGMLINSGAFNGMSSEDAKTKITEQVSGSRKTTYRLRDWVFSRQRYWGEPIPIIHCASCGVVPVPEADLPVVLPEVERYEPTGTGESPLAAIEEWVNVSCPTCSKPAKRETNTMPQWAGSSWYYLRYIDPKNDQAIASPEKMKYWLPVDVYFGGMEHTTLHLLYSRFWNLFLHDQGVVPVAEPYQLRKPHGIVLAADGEKMSKSRGNVVNPDDIVMDERYGADTLRTYELFLGPHEMMVKWNDQGIVGVRRFLDKVWNAFLPTKEMNDVPHLSRNIHKTVKKVTEDIEGFRFNTAISAMMIYINEKDFVKGAEADITAIKSFLKILSPFAPHMTAELWEQLGYEGTISQQEWPTYDAEKVVEDTVTIGVQINGKMRGTVTLAADATEADAKTAALADESIKKHIDGKEMKKFIYVPGRIINIIT